MATNVNIPINGRGAQLTYTTTISALVGGNTPQFVLPGGVNTWTVVYVLAGAGSLQMQLSANDPREVLNQNSNSGIPQVWNNSGTASTGGASQSVSGVGCPTMLRGAVAGGSGVHGAGLRRP